MRYLTILAILVFSSLALANDEAKAVAANISSFYQNPSKDRFTEFQQSTNKFEKEFISAKLTLALMTAKIHQKHGWPISESFYSETAQEILKGESDLARYINNDNLVDPNKLDMWWAIYFATGEEPSEGNIEALLVIRAASWSFKSNCKQHQAIRDYALKISKQEGLPEHKKKYLLEAVNQ